MIAIKKTVKVWATQYLPSAGNICAWDDTPGYPYFRRQPGLGGSWKTKEFCGGEKADVKTAVRASVGNLGQEGESHIQRASCRRRKIMREQTLSMTEEKPAVKTLSLKLYALCEL